METEMFYYMKETMIKTNTDVEMWQNMQPVKTDVSAKGNRLNKMTVILKSDFAWFIQAIKNAFFCPVCKFEMILIMYFLTSLKF